MFFNLVRENSRRSRKENTLFFVSLIVSIIAFYIILSLGNQDVIIFLKTMESDAVSKLLLITPVLYAFSLFILFFLVYFAGKYSLGRRNHEFGMYLMLGMRRRKLFFMLLLEEIWNSIISLAIGIPIAVFISEMISMITAKMVGLGIVGHNSSFSILAVLGTALGYFIIRLAALIILSGNIAKKEITQLLCDSQEKKHKKSNKIFILMKMIAGIILLAIAYSVSISGKAWISTKNMAIIVVLGLLGIFLLFNGIGILFDLLLKNNKKKNGLEIFTFRQVQENVFLKPNTLAIASLLVLISLCCFGYGISISLNSSKTNKNVLHYTFTGEEGNIKSELKNAQINEYIDDIFEVRLGRLYKYDRNIPFSSENLMKAVKNQDDSRGKDVLLNNLEYFTEPYMISVSGYNEILRVSGKDELTLNDNQVALYNGPDFVYENTSEILRDILKDKKTLEIDNKEYELIDKLCQENIVTDRSINISYGLIVPDYMIDEFTEAKSNNYFWNATLKKDFIDKNGLMQSIMQVNDLLKKTNLNYESYLQNMGRQLFYMVAASYTTIYLGIIFLIIANTFIGVQFLMLQQKNIHRYKTLVRLGCDYKDLCTSARKQIKWYFGFPIIIAVIQSFFGVRALFSGIASTEMQSDISSFMIISVPIILILCVVEFSYILAVMKMSDKDIYSLMDVKREDN